MFNKLQNLHNKPMLLLGALWPTVLLVPHLPGIPRPSVDGLPWRQELTLTFLLTVTLAFFILSKLTKNLSLDFSKKIQAPLILATMFVSWIWLSVSWATDSYQAMHLAIQWTSYLAFFALMISAPARIIKSSFVTLAAIVCMLAIACAIESWFGAPVTDGNLRVGVKPILRASGAFGEIMGAASILFAAFALHIKRRRPALMLGLTAVLGWLATLQSLERAPFIGTSIGLLVLVAGALFTTPRPRLWRLAVLSLALILTLALQVLPTKATDTGTSTVSRLQQNIKNDSSTQARLLLWGIGLEIFKLHPLIGVGGNNYQVNYAEGRAKFAARYPNSPLTTLNEHLLPIYAHNEYVQMLAELGLIGFLLFAVFTGSLVLTLVRALRSRTSRLPSLGAGCAILAFALSSGASASSFRYLSGGLIFFFAAALLVRLASSDRISETTTSELSRFPRFATVVVIVVCALVPLSLVVLSIQATGSTLQAIAEKSSDPIRAESYYRAALRIYPSNISSNFSYGMWLYNKGRSPESLGYLRQAVHRGLTSSVCYEYLAAAEEAAGDQRAAERTLAKAVQVYPRSVFLLSRHSVTLERLGRHSDAEATFAKALSIDARASRGWRHLILEDIDAASSAATSEPNTALPGELLPEAAVFAVLQENEMRDPGLTLKGWRKRMRSVDFGKRAE